MKRYTNFDPKIDRGTYVVTQMLSLIKVSLEPLYVLFIVVYFVMYTPKVYTCPNYNSLHKPNERENILESLLKLAFSIDL